MGPDNITLACTPRWLLSPTAMENILVNVDKYNGNAEITVTNVDDKNGMTKNGLWFSHK